MEDPKLIDEICRSSQNESQCLAILLPLTSRSPLAEGDGTYLDPKTILGNLERFLKSVVECHNFQETSIHFYIGLDDDDPYYLIDGSVQPDFMVLLQNYAPQASWKAYSFQNTAGQVCRIWRDLATQAYNHGADYFVLFGDDVELHTPAWFDKVLEAFHQIHSSLGPSMPFGFGSVAIMDRGQPSFPTFPVIHRTHFNIHETIFPQDFYNQDADPYLWQIYKRWSSSIFAKAELSNGIGGSQSPRYSRKHTPDWPYELLLSAILRVQNFLETHNYSPSFSTLVIDVGIPTTLSVPLSNLLELFEIKVPKGFETTFFLIIDGPKSNVIDFRKLAGKRGIKFTDWGPFRLIVRQQQGAGSARNVILNKSHADWVLFLDDDVKPSKDILLKYRQSIERFPECPGFIGMTTLVNSVNSSPNSFSMAAQSLNVTEFFGIADKMDHPPWGITANMVTKRTKIRFDPSLDSGEDIAYCIAIKKATGQKLHAVPLALVCHPWWSEGPHHFQSWAEGDGALLDLHPEYSYWDFPNVGELLIVFILVVIVGGLYDIIRGEWKFFWFPIWAIASALITEFFLQWFSTSIAHPTMSWRMLLICLRRLEILIRMSVGRMKGHFNRHHLRSFKHFCHRFDWSLGHPEMSAHGFHLRNSLLRFSLFLLMVSFFPLFLSTS